MIAKPQFAESCCLLAAITSFRVAERPIVWHPKVWGVEETLAAFTLSAACCASSFVVLVTSTAPTLAATASCRTWSMVKAFLTTSADKKENRDGSWQPFSP